MKMNEIVIAAAVGLLAYGAWVKWRRANETEEYAEDEETEVTGVWQELSTNMQNVAVTTLRLWRAPEKYAGMVAQAEAEYGVPSTMLERLLYQESRYRENIINGTVRSSAGAMGIAQFMPATAAQFGIDPLNPAQAIPAAARYLRQLHRRFGNWTEALAAYNWGQGNVSRRGLSSAPRETRNYYTQILADVANATGVTYT